MPDAPILDETDIMTSPEIKFTLENVNDIVGNETQEEMLDKMMYKIKRGMMI